MLATIQKELGLPVKWILVGTRNRWFHETCEAERLVELRLSIEEFQRRRQPGEGRRPSGDDDDDDDSLVVPDKLEDEDFDRLDKYVTSVKPFTAGMIKEEEPSQVWRFMGQRFSYICRC